MQRRQKIPTEHNATQRNATQGNQQKTTQPVKRQNNASNIPSQTQARTAQSKAKQYDSTRQKTKDKKENATQQGKHNATKEN